MSLTTLLQVDKLWEAFVFNAMNLCLIVNNVPPQISALNVKIINIYIKVNVSMIAN